jgi:hypothetical protein
MGISPIGGVIYANQNMQVPAAKQIDFQSKLDLQNVMAAELLNEKEKEVEEVRPTEETYKIDPEHEHEREKKDEESGEKENEEKLMSKAEKQIKEKKQSTHLLDIKV